VNDIIADLDTACLAAVLTVSEVCSLYNKTTKTVTELVKEGKLIGRQATVGTTWLISKRSCDERWDTDGRLKRTGQRKNNP